MEKDITIKEIEDLRVQAQNLIGEILDKYESMCPMVVESIEIGADEDTRRNVITFKDFYAANKETYIKPSEKDL